MGQTNWVTWCSAPDCVADAVQGGLCLDHRPRCAVVDCEKPRMRAELCYGHYKRKRRYGTVLDRHGRHRLNEWHASAEPPGLCAARFDSCQKPAKARGWCRMHHARWWRYGDVRLNFTRLSRQEFLSMDGAEEMLRLYGNIAEILDDYTSEEMMRRHGTTKRCSTIEIAPSWYWRRLGMRPTPRAVPLAGNHRHAYRIFCQHQLEPIPEGSK